MLRIPLPAVLLLITVAGFTGGLAPQLLTADAPPAPVTRTVIPTACANALDAADTAFTGPVAGGFDAAGRAFEAILKGDSSSLSTAERDLTTAGDDLTRLAPQYRAAATACRAAR